MMPAERDQVVLGLDEGQLRLLVLYLIRAAADIVDEALLAYGWGPEAGRG